MVTQISHFHLRIRCLCHRHLLTKGIMIAVRRRPPSTLRSRPFKPIAYIKRLGKLCSCNFPITAPSLRGVFVGLILGIAVTLFAVKSRTLPSPPDDDSEPLSSIFSSTSRYEIIREDVLTQRRSRGKNDHNGSPYSISGPTFAFVFSTGRCGTKHLSLALRPSRYTTQRTYITHEEEHASIATRTVVAEDYRRMASLSNESTFNTSMRAYIKKTKLPFFRTLLARHRARHLVYTGHVPTAFGLLPTLIDVVPRGSIRILRVRRDRIATALSLMALGVEEEDPWGIHPKRWFPVPTDAHVRLHVDSHVWNHELNRFQKWLWYIDDVECRWQALKHSARHSFSFLEVNIDDLHVLDGGGAWKEIASFLGTEVDLSMGLARHNSIQYKNKTKDTVSEDVVRQWDKEYRAVVGACRLSNDLSINWPSR